MHRNYRIAALAFALTVAACSIIPLAAEAAVTVTPSLKEAFDRTAAAADGSLRAALTSRYSSLMVLQEQIRTCEDAVKALRYANERNLVVLRGKIKTINAAEIENLQRQKDAAQQRYKPLFDSYTAMNRQTALARSLGSKQLTAVLRARAEAMKPAVQLAREDIRRKSDALGRAKAAAARTAKTVRATLAEADAVGVQVKAERSAAGSLGKRVSASWTAFGQFARKRDAAGALDSLTTLVSLSGQIADRLHRMDELERRIAAIYNKARGQLA